MEIVQRNFRHEDLPHLIEFRKKAVEINFPGHDLDEEKFGRRLIKFAEKCPECIQILEKGGDIIGYIWFGLKKGDLGKYGYLHQLFISENHRKRGLAKRLLVYAEKYLASNGVKKFRLVVTETNVPAIKLYEKMNYRKTRLVMEKSL